MREKYFSVYGKYGECRVVAVHKIFSKYTESMNSIQIMCGKNLLYAYMEDVKSISACSLVTPRDIKVCISQLIIII